MLQTIPIGAECWPAFDADEWAVHQPADVLKVPLKVLLGAPGGLAGTIHGLPANREVSSNSKLYSAFVQAWKTLKPALGDMLPLPADLSWGAG